jgi:guanosine-3',5'-bis(diphosphate) 3'-pyrophosphohydrolase
MILRAIDFAARKHRDQRRKDGSATPYLNHPIAVALLLAEVGGVQDAEVLAAAVLHDTLEDTETTRDELERAFGPRVCRIVEEVTDNRHLSKAERKRLQIVRASQLSPGAALIKLGDKISNVLDVVHSPPLGWSWARRWAYLDWAEAVIQSCGNVNPRLERRFAEVLAEGRRLLQNSAAH